MKKGEVVRIDCGVHTVVVRNTRLGGVDLHVELECHDEACKPVLLAMTPDEAKRLADALEFAWNFSKSE